MPRKVKIREEEYLSLILDCKEESYGSVFLTFTSAFGKKWGLNTRLVYTIYTTMMRQILSYGALVWGPI